jgi:carboxylate-amine ligase
VAARTVGIEEELLLVDSETGVARAVANVVLKDLAADEQHSTADRDPEQEQPDEVLEAELQRQQIETHTQPRERLVDLVDELRARRGEADVLARRSGARVAALATSPLPVEAEVMPVARYQRMIEHLGLTTRQQLICGAHVHVSVDSDDEAIAVLDRIRPWLPTLLALSTNSPFWQGNDTAYASFRSQVAGRWPSHGPMDVFGSTEEYRRIVEAMVATGVLLDSAMVSFDARSSERYPTVEIRVADICLDVRDSVVVAGLTRGLVEAAAREWRAGQAPADVPTAVLRLANWRAGRSSVDGPLLDPLTGRPRAAGDVVEKLVEHVSEALESTGDHAWVVDGVERILNEGTGAHHQRAAFERGGDLRSVVLAAAEATQR